MARHRNSPAAIEQWADQKRTSLIEYAQAVELRRQGPGQAEDDRGDIAGAFGAAGPFGAMSGQSLSEALGVTRGMHLSGFARKPDTRTVEEYIEQVDEWRERLHEAAAESLLEHYLAAGNCGLRIQVKNVSPRFLQDVELDLIVDWNGASVYEDAPSSGDLPEPPRKFGEPSPAAFESSLLHSQLTPPHVYPIYTDRPSPIRRARAMSDVVGARYRIGNLPQGRTASSELLFLLGTTRPSSVWLRPHGKRHYEFLRRCWQGLVRSGLPSIR